MLLLIKLRMCTLFSYCPSKTGIFVYICTHGCRLGIVDSVREFITLCTSLHEVMTVFHLTKTSVMPAVVECLHLAHLINLSQSVQVSNMVS